MNKGLKAIRFAIGDFSFGRDFDGSYYTREDIENELKRLETYEKEIIKLTDENLKQYAILRIIKDKRVDVGWLISCETLAEYNNVVGTATHNLLTQKEFDLLKEVLL